MLHSNRQMPSRSRLYTATYFPTSVTARSFLQKVDATMMRCDSHPGDLMSTLDLLAGTFAICRLRPDAPLPEWALTPASFMTISRTPDELSVTVEQGAVPADVQAERGYRAFKVRGPLGPELVGILLSIAQPLAEADLSIFAVSTYDTDYVLVKAGTLPRAVEALRRAGHTVTGAPAR
jgi:hypothetical protein